MLLWLLRRLGGCSSVGHMVPMSFLIQWTILVHGHLLCVRLGGTRSTILSSCDWPILGPSICRSPLHWGQLVGCIGEYSCLGSEIPFSSYRLLLLICWQLLALVMEQPLSPLSYLFDLINYASLILLNKLSILFHPIIVWPCGQYYKVQGWAHV